MNKIDVNISHPLNRLLLNHLQTRTPERIAVGAETQYHPDSNSFPMTQPAFLGGFTTADSKPATRTVKRFAGIRQTLGNMFTRSGR